MKGLQIFILAGCTLLVSGEVWHLEQPASDYDEEDPCVDYVPVNDRERSVTYTPQSYDTLLCDWNVPSILSRRWHRFTHHVGGMLAEDCVQAYHCGTQAPIWMANQKHPIDYDIEVDRKVCANYDNPFNCCEWNATIQVRRCRGNSKDSLGYYIYNLVEPPGCSVAYCAGNKTACQDWEVFNIITQECHSPFPTVHGVNLHNPIVEFNYVHFYCEINYDSPIGDTDLANVDNGARFEVKFYFDQNEIEGATVIIKPPTKRTYLREHFLRGNLGKLLTCGVRSYWVGMEEYASQWQTSKPYFVGIKADPSHIVVGEEDDVPVKLYLQSTIPIVCKNPNHKGKCEVAIRVLTPKRLVTSQSDAGGCMYRISREDWRDDESLAYNKSTPLTIMVKRDPISHREETHNIEFAEIGPTIPDFVRDEGGNVKAVEGVLDMAKPEDVRVTVRSEHEAASCQSTSDPRVRTWDGSGYDILDKLGQFDYVMSNSSRGFQVHARHWLCKQAWFVSCVCAVAVREGNTVLAIDMCDGRYHSTPRPKITQMSENGKLKGAEITRDPSGKVFHIKLVSSTTIKVEVQKWGMNFYMSGSSEDYGKAMYGLCGSYDEDFSNDMLVMPPRLAGPPESQDDFIENWRIPRGQSLFEKRPPSVEEPEQIDKFCDCNKGEITCDWREKVDPSSNVPVVDIPINPLHLKIWDDDEDDLIRKRRSLRHRREVPVSEDHEYTDEVEEGSYEFDFGEDLHVVFRNITFPTPSGISEEAATTHCAHRIADASFFPICKEVLGDKIWIPRDKCVDDIRLMDDFSWADNAINEIQFQCVMDAMRKYPNLIGDILKHICPGQCSFHGKCFDGHCFCDNGWDGADCSLQAGQVPEIRYIPNNGLCDVTRRPCMRVRVIAEGIKDSPQLSCHVTQVEITNGQKIVLEHTANTTNATMISATEVSCELPLSPVAWGTPTTHVATPVHGMKISVSNDGDRFSESLLLIIYDSTCQACTSDGSCWRKEMTCLINGHCFAAGDADPDNWCRVCQPTKSSDTFLPRKVNDIPYFTTQSTLYKLPEEDLVVQIEAVDPEDRPLVYRGNVSTAYSIEIDEEGVLTWGSDGKVDEDVHMVVSISDECGKGASQTFVFKFYECTCQNGGVCSPDMNYARGIGQYICICPDGYSGSLCETDIDDCASHPCVYGDCSDRVNGFTCECAEGYVGDVCDRLESSIDPNAATTGEWSAWNTFSECSRMCDYGYRVRQRECLLLPCSGEGSEVRMCHAFNCAELDQEKTQGAVMVIKDTNILTVRQREQDLLYMVAVSVNIYCFRNPTACCEMVGVKDGHIKQNVISAENLYVASGFPHLLNEKLFGLKVIGKYLKYDLQKICMNTKSRKKRSSPGASYINSTILLESILVIQTDINKMLGIDMKEVVMPDMYSEWRISPELVDYDNDYDDLITKDLTKRDFLWVVGAAAGIFMVIVILITVTVSMIDRYRKKKLRERRDSQKRLTHKPEKYKTAQVPRPRSSRSRFNSVKDNFFYLFGGDQRNNDDGISVVTCASKDTVKSKFFYKIAVNDGLAQQDAVTSADLQLTLNDDIGETSTDVSRSNRDITTQHVAVQFNPKESEKLPKFRLSVEDFGKVKRSSSKNTVWQAFNGQQAT